MRLTDLGEFAEKSPAVLLLIRPTMAFLTRHKYSHKTVLGHVKDMSNKSEITRGIILGILVFLTLSTASVYMFGTAVAQQAPLFSVTLIASTGNPVRRQYATIIASGMQSLGINARVFYLNFDQLSNRMFFYAADQGTLFDQGGYDIGFIGWGPSTPIPDFRSNFDGRSAFLAPTGNNYALYNSPEMNAIFDELYSTADVNKQLELTYKMEALVLHDAPYNYIYTQEYAVPRNPYWTSWGDKNAYDAVTFPDVEHWAGGTELTYAEASNIFPGNTLNPFSTVSSNTWYAVFVYGAICYSMAGLQQIDTRDLTFHNAIATDISVSEDLLTWRVKMRPGVLFHSGVEMTADDALFTRWAILNPKTASVGLGSDIQYLGNVVDFTWLDGTTSTLDNRAAPDEPERKGTWRAIDKYTFEFTLPEYYPFTRQFYCAYSVLPKHIYEQFPPETWDTQSFSTADKPYTYTWDTAKYGGTGSYTALGPVGAGPYILESYDFTRNMATLRKFKDHWWRAEGEAAGMFTVETYRVVWIESKDAAIAALKNGEVNVLDYNFQLPLDKQTLLDMGMNVISKMDLGWQEMGFNMRHPVFGTGVDTPAGKADPAQAAEAARHVRKAISYIIPRQQIVDQLLGGAGAALATCVGPAWGPWYDSSLKPDPFDANKAAQELQAAGYSVAITPPAKIAAGGTPIMTTGTRVKGYTSVAGMIVEIQQSSDKESWTPVAAVSADMSGSYEVAVPGPPVFGSAWYRANFTGYAMNQTFAGQSFSVEQANAYINQGAAIGGSPDYRVVPPSLTDPIAVSSVTNDAAVVLVIVIVLILIAVLAMRRRKPAVAKPK
jgi:ABC-type transport system substrate-binding protein